jgi:hypothetical protein
VFSREHWRCQSGAAKKPQYINWNVVRQFHQAIWSKQQRFLFVFLRFQTGISVRTYPDISFVFCQASQANSGLVSQIKPLPVSSESFFKFVFTNHPVICRHIMWTADSAANPTMPIVVICIVGGGVQTGSTRHAYSLCELSSCSAHNTLKSAA